MHREYLPRCIPATKDTESIHLSQPLTLSTGAPQGFVLTTWYFSICTNSLIYTHSLVYILKYSNDTTITGLIANNKECHYHE